MPLASSTFKLSDEDRAILTSLAADLSCSRTEVIRRALRSLQKRRDQEREIA